MYNEPEFIKLIFLLADIKQWVTTIEKDITMQLPMQGKKTIFKNKNGITVEALAHILERHYSKILRHPEKGKFTIDIPAICSHIKTAFLQQPEAVPATGGLSYQYDTGETIGYDRNNNPSSIITVITNQHGELKTAFPGKINNKSN